MNELLFGSVKEQKALENVLALNQIKKCDKEIAKYTEEIKAQKDEMMSILRDKDIDEDYIEKINKYNNLLRNIDGDSGRISELEKSIKENEDKINVMQDEVASVQNRLEELKKEIFETTDSSKIIDCQNEIENLNVKLNDLNDELEEIVSANTPLLIEREYLVAKNSNGDINISNMNKKSLEKELKDLTAEFNKAIEDLDLPIRENIEFCQKKINNRELEIEKYNARKNKVIDAFPDSIAFDITTAYEDLKDLLRELNLSEENSSYEEETFFEDEDIEEPKKIEEPIVEEDSAENDNDEDLKDELSLLDRDEPVDDEVESKEEKNDTDIKEETEEESSSEEVGSVSYVLSDGESLMNIAEKVYPSKDNWQAIYYFNKDSIDKYLVSNGINNDFDTVKELADDTNLFTGIKLEIPTDYNYKK